MSVRATSWAWELARSGEIGGGLLLTLLRVADHADNEGICWPGEKSLAEYTGHDQRTVRRHLSRLEAEGHLRRERQGSEGGRGRGKDRILLHLDQPDILSGEDPDVQPDISSASTGHSEHVQPDISSTPLYREPSVEPSGTASSARANYPAVLAALERVTFARSAASVTPDSVNRCCEQFADRDLEAEAERFAHYWTDGPGAKKSLKNVGWAWRNWLERARPAESKAPRDSVADDLRRLEAEADRLRAEEAIAA